MSQQDSQIRLSERHRSHRPPPKPGRKITHAVGYMATKRLRRVALCGLCEALEHEYAGREDKPTQRQIMRIAVERYYSSLKNEPAVGMLG